MSAASVPPHMPSPDGDVSHKSVLEAPDIPRALTRIAHEILERNKGGRDLVLLGIPTRGVPLADRHRRPDRRASRASPCPVGSLDVTMYRDDLRLQPGPRAARRTEIPDGGIDGKVVVLVDDVLFSGRTIRAALDALNDLGRPRAVQLAVLVDRGHRELPIRADYVGKNLPDLAAPRRSGCRLDGDRRRATRVARSSRRRPSEAHDEAPPALRRRPRPATTPLLILDTAEEMARRWPTGRSRSCRRCAAAPSSTSSSRTPPAPASPSRPPPSGCRPTSSTSPPRAPASPRARASRTPR